MKSIYFTVCFALFYSFAEGQIKGYVFSQATREPLEGATVTLIPSKRVAVTESNGFFSILSPAEANDSLVVAFIGYYPNATALADYDGTELKIGLVPDAKALQTVEIVNTGYQSLPRERATGSFEIIDNKLLNRSAGADILSRLEGVASGLQFVSPNGTNPSDIRVRGLGTIESDETPLIILDNFPYDGDISNINPNDVASVTVLRDAAASSIWGARAGNGVIVIATKKGSYGQRTNISANGNITTGMKPNLFYSRSRLPSSDVMEIERKIYEHNGYAMSERTPLPAYVEQLILLREGLIAETEFLEQERKMQATEIRREIMDHLYRYSLSQQYSVEASGGADNIRYMMSFGYDKQRASVIGNMGDRLNFSAQNTFRPIRGLELSGGMRYVFQQASSNALSTNDLTSGNVNNQYLRLAGDNGESLPVVKDYRWDYVSRSTEDDLLDWYYRPLDEIMLNKNESKSTALLLMGEALYSINKILKVKGQYQYAKNNSGSHLYHDRESYYVRNLVNRFTQPNGTRVIPYGGILRGGNPAESRSHSVRLQLDAGYSMGDHQIDGIVGAEARQHVSDLFQGYTTYNFDEELFIGVNQFDFTTQYLTRPAGRSRIPNANAIRQQHTDRFLSYFGNVGYRLLNRYSLSFSGRWDGSNLFGVKTNQKGRLLWSSGAVWEINKESFYSSHTVPVLRFRVTYGSSGNVNKTVSHYPTIRLDQDEFRGTVAHITSTGNPSLRWEQVNMANFGMDFGVGRRIRGDVEYYVKKAKDLIGNQFMPPSTGLIGDYKVNYANLSTQGVDLRLTTTNVPGPLNWKSHFLISYVSNEITHYNTSEVSGIVHYITAAPPPVVGRSRDAVYALPWHGLDPQSGFPVVFIHGEQSTDYARYYYSRTAQDLLVKGVWVPPFHGSFRNEMSWKGFSASVLLTWKAGHVFRRTSLSSGEEFYGIYHMDYYKRWKQTGDERYTNVPAAVGIGEEAELQSTAYNFSEALVERGAHLRFRDVNLSYSFAGTALERYSLNTMRVYMYMRNIGLLWKQNKLNIDPDYANAEFTPPFSMAIGLQIGF